MDYLNCFTKAPAASGCEAAIYPSLKELLAPFTNDVRLTPLGSTLAFIPCGKKDAKKLLLSAHIDSVAAFVTELLDGGFLRIAVNGMDRRVILNAEFTVAGRGGSIRALPCVLPPHLQKESGKVPEDRELILDTGLSREKLGEAVSVGDPVLFTRSYTKLLNGRTACASADNGASCAAVMRALELAAGREASFDVIAAFTSMEEAGAAGAATAAFATEPDEAIILDVTFAQTPDTHSPEAGKLGGGVMIGVSPLLSRRVTEALRCAAKRIGAKWQTEVMPRSTGTDADEISKSGRGVPCGMLSIPLRYMHTPSEVTDNADIESTAAVLAEYIING